MNVHVRASWLASNVCVSADHYDVFLNGELWSLSQDVFSQIPYSTSILVQSAPRQMECVSTNKHINSMYKQVD